MRRSSTDLEQMILQHAHSLVACILSIVIIFKVATIKNPSRLNQDSDTTEHDMPRVPAQGSSKCVSIHKDLQYMRACMHACVRVCVRV